MYLELTDYISNEFYAFEFLIEQKIKEKRFLTMYNLCKLACNILYIVLI